MASPMRALLLMSLAPVTFAAAQTAVPPTSGTEATAPASTTPRTPHRADVSFSGGLLTVNAQNASLNQLIREIARQSGMRVSGSVAEDRVFGSYGPAEPSKVLSLLLDGTGSNVLIVADAADSPLQLILTPRLGAPTPPNPNTVAENDADSEDGAPPVSLPFRRGGPRRAFPSNAPNSQNQQPPLPAAAAAQQQVGGISLDPAATTPSSNDQTVAFPQVSPNTTPSTASSTPDSNNPPDSNVKTPQQIFEQLQRLQQQTPPQQ